MSKKLGRCSRCKKQLLTLPHKVGGGQLCDECYPFIRSDSGRLIYRREPEAQQRPILSAIDTISKFLGDKK